LSPSSAVYVQKYCDNTDEGDKVSQLTAELVIMLYIVLSYL